MRLRIATYNVHGCVGTDGKFDVQRVADAVRALEAQVVLLQEVGDARKVRPPVNQAEQLAAACAMGYEVGITMPCEPWGYGNAVLTTFGVAATARFDLSVARKEPRGCLRIGVDLEGLPLTVIAVHLGLSRGERRRQIATLIHGGALAAGDHALVIGGDWNDFPPGPTAELPRHGFVDAALALRDQRGSYPSRLPLLRLDRLYSRGDIRPTRYDVVSSRLHKLASDHLPVIADYELTMTRR